MQEIHDSEVITLGQYSWTAVATPGHDAHLLCYWKRRTAMFAYSDLLSTRGTAIPWYAPGRGGTSACLDSLRRATHEGAVLSISGHGCLLEGADAVAASAAATARQVTARTERMTAVLARGPVAFSDLEQWVYPPEVHDVIPWSSSVAMVHLLVALQSGSAGPAACSFRLTGTPG